VSALFRRAEKRGTEPVEAVAEVDSSAEVDSIAEVDSMAEPAAAPRVGPWDVAELPDPEGRLDLGALRVLGRDAMELRLEVENETGRVTSLTIAIGGSLVQIQVFAAPRSAGIWDEIRAEIAEGIVGQGGTVTEQEGTFGSELVARIPVRTPDGRSGHQPARFAGVDGPRWFLRAVFNGQAVQDPAAAAPLEAVFRDLVVVRGDEAMAPRELLSLKLPPTMGGPEAEPEAEDPGRPPLEPFTRGPEITEIH
jgi:hypothetical protein